MTLTEGIAISFALAALILAALNAASSAKRYKRLRRRLSRVDERSKRLRSELLPTLRPIYADYVARQVGHLGSLPASARGELGEDMILLALFSAREDGSLGKPPSEGFFIEAGGFDGRLNSPTWLFESIGWRGLLVEPMQHLAQQATASRPGSRVVNAALGRSGASGHATLRVYAPEHQSMNRTDLASHIEGADDGGVSRPPAREGQSVQVPLTTLAALLQESETGAPDRVDLLILDVEGSELNVLDGLDLSKNQPRVLVVEDHTAGTAHPAFLRPFGYIELCRIDFNRIYVHESEQAMIAVGRDLLALDQVGIA